MTAEVKCPNCGTLNVFKYVIPTYQYDCIGCKTPLLKELINEAAN